MFGDPLRGSLLPLFMNRKKLIFCIVKIRHSRRVIFLIISGSALWWFIRSSRRNNKTERNRNVNGSRRVAIVLARKWFQLRQQKMTYWQPVSPNWRPGSLLRIGCWCRRCCRPRPNWTPADREFPDRTTEAASRKAYSRADPIRTHQTSWRRSRNSRHLSANKLLGRKKKKLFGKSSIGGKSFAFRIRAVETRQLYEKIRKDWRGLSEIYYRSWTIDNVEGVDKLTDFPRWTICEVQRRVKLNDALISWTTSEVERLSNWNDLWSWSIENENSVRVYCFQQNYDEFAEYSPRRNLL